MSRLWVKLIKHHKMAKNETIECAWGEQEQALVIAEAEAEVIRKKAQAQADANKLLSESLTPEVVEYEKIQKWDGKLPYATGTG